MSEFAVIQDLQVSVDRAQAEVARLRAALRHVLSNNAFVPGDECRECDEISAEFADAVWSDPDRDRWRRIADSYRLRHLALGSCTLSFKCDACIAYEEATGE